MTTPIVRAARASPEWRPDGAGTQCARWRTRLASAARSWKGITGFRNSGTSVPNGAASSPLISRAGQPGCRSRGGSALVGVEDARLAVPGYARDGA